MNFIFISPQFPQTFWNFCDRLKKNGVNVLGIGDSPYDNLAQNVKDSLTEYYYLPSLEDYDGVFRAVAYRELKVRTDERSALFISSILFGIHHGALLSALYGFCAGILLALFFRDHGGIRASFAAHACMNLLTLVLSASGALGTLSSPGFCAAFFGLLALSAALYLKEAV